MLRQAAPGLPPPPPTEPITPPRDILESIVINMENLGQPEDTISPDTRLAITTVHNVLTDTILNAIEKKYGSPKNYFAATLEIAHIDDEFSWREVFLILAALTLGGLAPYFVIGPASQAIETIASIIKSLTGYQIHGTKVLKLLMVISGYGEGVAVATLSGDKMLHYYFGKTTADEDYLLKSNAILRQKLFSIFMKVLCLGLAVSTNVIVFLLIKAIWELALPVASANISISWKGFMDLVKGLYSLDPARRVVLDILNEEMQKFLKLTPEQQQQVINKIEAMHTNKSDDVFKNIYLALLTLSHIDTDITLAPAPPQMSLAAKTCNYTVATGCAASETLCFTFQSALGVNGLFKDQKSAVAVTSSVATFGLATPTALGFGASAGFYASNALTSGNVTLASRFKPYLYTTCRWLIRPFSAFSGGMFFTLGYNTTNSISSFFKIKGKLLWALKIIVPSVCYTGGSTENDLYTMTMFDNMYVYYAQRCGNSQEQRLFAFVTAARKCYSVLAEMSKENYFKYLKYKLNGDSNLKTFLLDAFEKRLKPEERDKMFRDIEKYTQEPTAPEHQEAEPPQAKRPWFGQRLWCSFFWQKGRSRQRTA